MLYGFIKAILTVIMKLFFPTKTVGKENFVRTGSIIVCNHFSAWDIPLVGTAAPFRLSFLGKKELFKTRFFNWLFKRMGGIPVDRENAGPATMREVIKRLKEGKNLLLFPEGHRNRGNEEQLTAIKNGAALFAISAKVPIVPAVIAGKPRPFKRNYFAIGKPIDVSSFKTDKESIQKAADLMKQSMESLQQQLAELKKSGKKAAH